MENKKERIVIRLGQHHLSFSSVDPTETENPITYEPYVVKSGMSMAANLREALKGAALQESGIRKVLAMIDAKILLVPVEQFEESKITQMYNHSFPQKQQQDSVFFNVLPDLNAVAVFALNKDMKMVLDDNFAEVKLMTALTPVWKYLHRRSFTGVRNKLYGYLHDQKLDIFAFHQNRFKFYNQFDVTRQQDALYFLLYVWKQLLLSAEQDELHLVGDTEGLVDELRKYLLNVYAINPSADFNRAPATKIKGMPFDLITLFTKGR
jgi:hypothetical protein